MKKIELRVIRKEHILGAVEGMLKALTMIDDDQMVTSLRIRGGEYVVELEKE